MKISVVIPCYNSEQSIAEVVDLTKDELLKLGYEYEFVLVNDYSMDNTFNEIKNICAKDYNVKGINLAKNFGQHNALMAGFKYITGDIIIGMDDDLQTHPSQLNKLIDEFNKGYDIVYGVYKEKKHSFFRNLGSRFAQYTVVFFTKLPNNIRISSYWIAKRFIIEECYKYNGPRPNIIALFVRSTNSISNIEVEHFEREYGTSNYNLKKLVKLWLSFLDLSTLPLRFASIFGIIMSAFGGLSTLYLIIRKIIFQTTLQGWTSLMVAILLFSGILLLSIGIIGEYLGRLFMYNNNTPQYVIRELKNMDKKDEV